MAAIFTLKLLRGDKANATLVETAASKPDLREFALRALLEKKNDPQVPIKPFLDAVGDENPRVQLVAAWGIGRLGHADGAPQLLQLTTSPDFLVAHVATNALVSLNAIDVCLDAVAPSTSPTTTAGALKALQQIHDMKVVTGLTEHSRACRTRPPARWRCAPSAGSATAKPIGTGRGGARVPIVMGRITRTPSGPAPTP